MNPELIGIIASILGACIINIVVRVLLRCPHCRSKKVISEPDHEYCTNCGRSWKNE